MKYTSSIMTRLRIKLMNKTAISMITKSLNLWLLKNLISKWSFLGFKMKTRCRDRISTTSNKQMINSFSTDFVSLKILSNQIIFRKMLRITRLYNSNHPSMNLILKASSILPGIRSKIHSETRYLRFEFI